MLRTILILAVLCSTAAAAEQTRHASVAYTTDHNTGRYWVSPTQACEDDSLWSVHQIENGEWSESLILYDFDFDIPSNATITAIYVTADVGEDCMEPIIDCGECVLLSAWSLGIGPKYDDQLWGPATTLNWDFVDGVGGVDLGDVSPTVVNDSSFGLSFRCISNGSDGDSLAKVQTFDVTIMYTTP